MSEVVLLCSGGLDSTTVAYWLRERGTLIAPIFFDYGQHCVEKEWATLQEVLPKEGISTASRIDISGIFAGSRSRLIQEPNLWSDHVADAELYVPYRGCLLRADAGPD